MIALSKFRISYREKLVLFKGRECVLHVVITPQYCRATITQNQVKTGDYSVIRYDDTITFDYVRQLANNDMKKAYHVFMALRVDMVSQYRSIERPCSTTVTTIYEKQW